MADSTDSSELTSTSCPVKAAHSARGKVCDSGPYRLPKFSLQFLALATALMATWYALWPISSIASRGVLAAIMLTFLFGCARTRRAVLVMLPALYLPHAWIFVIPDYPWTEYRWFWVRMFWQLPGLVPEALVRQFTWRSEWWQFGWMAIFTILIWLAVVTLGRRGGFWLKATALAAFLLSLPCAWLEHNLFRM